MKILTKSEKIELISKKIGKLTKGVTAIDDNTYIRKIQQKERIMFTEQQEILVNGVWMIIDEMIDHKTAWAIDQDGGEHEITADMVDHYFPKV